MSDRKVIGLGCLSAIVILLIPLAVWGFRVGTAEWRGRGEAHIQIQSAASRIAAYNHFFEACSSIQGLEGRIDELTAQHEAESDPRNKSIVLASLTGTKAARHAAIADYNADARKNYTEGQFRDSDLPYQIADSNYPTEGAKTSCGYE